MSSNTKPAPRDFEDSSLSARPTADGRKLMGKVLGFLLSGAIILYLVLTMDWQKVWTELQGLNVGYLLLSVLTFAFSFYLRACRWTYLLPSSEHYERRNQVDALLVGNLASLVLPFRAGEFLRPWIFSRWENVRFPAAFASVVTERVFDVLAVVVLFGLCMHELPELSFWMELAAQALIVISAGIVAAMVFSYLMAETSIRWIEWGCDRILSKFLPGLSQKLSLAAKEFIFGLRAIASIKELLLCLVFTALVWGTYCLMYLAGLWAFGTDASPTVAVMVVVLTALAVAAPSAPGFVGTFHTGAIAAVMAFGFSYEFGIAYALIMHAAQFMFGIAAGLYRLFARGLGFKDLSASR